jgi:hypothetical protein
MKENAKKRARRIALKKTRFKSVEDSVEPAKRKYTRRTKSDEQKIQG